MPLWSTSLVCPRPIGGHVYAKTTCYGSDLDRNHAAIDHPTRIFPAGWTDPAALGLERALRIVD